MDVRITCSKKSLPIPRREVFDLYWYFAAERQKIFDRRLSGANWPWTEDRILQVFKFCNVYRAADRVTQYLLRNVAYHTETCTPEDRLFQIVAFRTFSRIETWRTIRQQLRRYPTLDDLRDGALESALETAKSQNGGLYTGAFILCANKAYGRLTKHLNHLELFRDMFLKDRLGERLLGVKSLKEVYTLLHEYPLMGDFMSYQTAIDLNYSDLVNFSENEFTQAGPGAIRGIQKVFVELGDFTPNEIIMWMVERQSKEFDRLGLYFPGLGGRRLHAIDCQGLFCEVDKYCREAFPELRSGRKRIKTRFRPSSAPLSYFFPPKWGINEKFAPNKRDTAMVKEDQLEDLLV